MRTLSGTILAATSLALGLHAEALSWGARDEHPAVVNPVMACDPSNVVSLRGEWEFVAHPMNKPLRNGVWGRFYQETNWPGSRAIAVPGCWEAQGVGEPGMGECWVPKWDNNAKPIRHKYMGDLLMVGEGGQDCFAYVALRRGGEGLAVESFGLDLVSGKPEGTAILDGMIDFSRSHGPLAGARK